MGAYGWSIVAGLVAVAVLVFLLVLVRHIGRRTLSVRDSAPMDPGWVMLGKGAIWSKRSAGRPGTFSHIGNALENTISLSIPPAANMAWRCERCRLLLIDHGKLVSG
ncbi:MAG: hypothetical protein MUC77_15015 [Chromatiaceae bacterium]|nr:hypothetical protein [Chromatiaceae bacterium]